MKYLKTYETYSPSNRELLDELDSGWLVDWYMEKYPPHWGFGEMLEFLSGDLWRYVDDDKFVEDWIDDRADADSQDFKYANFSEGDMKDFILERYENTGLDASGNTMYEHIRKILIDKEIGDEEDDRERLEEIKEMDLEEILDELDEDELKDIIEDDNDEYDFCHQLLENIYRNSSAFDVLGELHSEDELNDVSFFKDDHYNIQSYMDEKSMEEDMNDVYDYGYVRDNIDLEEEDELQEEIWKKDPSTSKTLVEEEIVSDSLASQYEFQKSYIELAKKEIEKDVEENRQFYKDKDIYDEEDEKEFEEEKLNDLWEKVKEYFFDKDILNKKIIKEYGFEPFVEAEKFNF